MEHAPLRPVPARPAGPIDTATALREVESWLPTLAPESARALALVVLADRPRAEVAETLGLPEARLAGELAAARKELRQTIVVLGGSGWCERAEGLISDRLDGPLRDRDARRLDVHLRNCSRCVEHERRLVQATDALIAGASTVRRLPAPVDDPSPLVEATPPAPEPARPDRDGPAPPEEAVPAPAPPAPTVAVPTPPEPSAAAPTVSAPDAEQIAAAAEVLVVARTRRQIATAVVWNSLIAIAILLTLATIALAIAGILGAGL